MVPRRRLGVSLRRTGCLVLLLGSCETNAPPPEPDAVPTPAPSGPTPSQTPAPAPPPSPSTPAPAPTPESAAVQTSLASAPASPAIVARARAIQKDLECLRGRPFVQDPGIEFQSLEDFGKYLERQIDKEFGGEKGARTERLLHALRIVDPSIDVAAMLRKSALEQAAAYYDPETDTFYVVQDMPDMVLDMVMAHELQHAQQDQHTKLMDRYLEGDFDTLDGELAARFLVEGEATLVGTAWMVKDMSAGMFGGVLGNDVCYLPGRESTGSLEAFWVPLEDMLATQAAQTRADVQDPGILGKLATRMMSKSMYDSMKNLRDLPSFFFYSLLLPYNVGALTVYAPMKAAAFSWKGVDRLFEHPPETTEQALHPEKLIGRREAFSRPDLPAIAHSDFAGAQGWEADPVNRIGELTIRILLIEHGMSEREATDAAGGWRGDAARVFRKQDMLAYDWKLEWDGNADAIEFRTRVPAMIRAQHPGVAFSGDEAAAESARAKQGQIDFSWTDPQSRTRHGRMAWMGRTVYVIDGFDWPLQN